jgi:hypothetical protein
VEPAEVAVAERAARDFRDGRAQTPVTRPVLAVLTRRRVVARALPARVPVAEVAEVPEAAQGEVRADLVAVDSGSQCGLGC